MNYEVTNSQTNITYILENNNLTISKKNKIYYADSANGVIILYVGEKKDIHKNEYLQLILSLPSHSENFLDIFRGDDLNGAREFIQELMKSCEFLNLNYMNACFYKRSNVSATNDTEETHQTSIKKQSSLKLNSAVRKKKKLVWRKKDLIT